MDQVTDTYPTVCTPSCDLRVAYDHSTRTMIRLNGHSGAKSLMP